MKKILLTVFSALVFVLPAQAAYDTNAGVPVVGKQIVTKNGLPSTITFKVVDTDIGNEILSKRHDCYDVVGNLRFNRWNNRTTLQFMIADIKRAK